MKKPSSRSQRGSRGIKGKHVLQICVLLGVCIWLIYQVKYSHDKKKEIYETDGEKLSEKVDGLVKLGRKDLLPGYHKNDKEEEDEEEKESKRKVVNGIHEEGEEKEEEEVGEEDEEDKSKLGEEVVEEDEEENKHEEDDIDEQDQSKTTEDSDKDDELLEEEKEKETNHADEIDMRVDEAREEHYKADDASSAVSHESSRILNTEKLKESSDKSTQENNVNATVSELEVQKEPVLKLGEAESDSSMEKSTTEVKDGDSESSNSEAKSLVTESRGETTVNGNTTEAVLEASGFLQNETRIMQERSQEDSAPPSRSSDVQTVESDPNITVSANITNIDSIQDESRNSSSVNENISGSNTTEVKENSTSEGDDETVEYKESSNVFSTEQTEEADDDTTSESTMLQEEREALTDPQTLPDIRIEGNEDDEEEAISAE